MRSELNRQISFRSDDNVEVDPNYFINDMGDIENNDYSKEAFLKGDNINNVKRKILDTNDKYSLRYRFLKTFLLLLTWISFGYNFEIIGPTLEDLKIYLNVNYSEISFGLVLRNIGYLSMTIVFGILLDRISKYSDLIMAISSSIVALTSFTIPITKNYTVSMIYFLMQGFSQSIYDLTGNIIILSLWCDISSSPINTMHGGYGIGAMLATQIAKPFIKFDQYNKIINLKSDSSITSKNYSELKILNLEKNISTSYDKNGNVQFGSESIDLKVPYWTGSCFSFILAVLFLIAQFIEKKNNSKYEKLNKEFLALNQNKNENKDLNETFSLSFNFNTSELKLSKLNLFFQKLFFRNRIYEGRALAYMLLQISLFTAVFIFSQGCFTIISRFMLTYLTMGPAQLNIPTYALMQTLFWGFFIFGRFFATYLSFKFDPVNFFLFLLISNAFICFLFMIPGLSGFRIFFWIFVPLLGLSSGPIMPTCLMIAKELLEFNSFVLSLFIIGLAVGGIIFQEITGKILDLFNPSLIQWLGFSNSSYLIPYLSFFSSFITLFIFLQIYFLFKRFDYSKKFKYLAF